MTSHRARPTRRAVLGGATALAAAAAVVPGSPARAQGTPDLSGRSVLITGTSSGFGRLTALHLARLGATTVASMRNLSGGRRPEAVELSETARAEGLDLHVVEIDVTDDGQVAEGVARAEEIAGGALDVLVNNAGIAFAGPVEIADMAATRRIFDTNVYGPQRMARAVLPKMRAAERGQIVAISSQLGRFLLPNLGLYQGTKFALEAMNETMAYELAPFGIEVTIVEPGGYPTEIWENGRRYTDEILEGLDAERRDAYGAHISIAQGMMGGDQPTDPMDVPRAIADLMSMPAGSRPLRRPVHPNTALTDAINDCTAQVQERLLSGGRFADWWRAVAT